MEALKVWHGGVILISHDERFINNVCKQLWVCADGTLSKWCVSLALFFRGMPGDISDDGLHRGGYWYLQVWGCQFVQGECTI